MFFKHSHYHHNTITWLCDVIEEKDSSDGTLYFAYLLTVTKFENFCCWINFFEPDVNENTSHTNLNYCFFSSFKLFFATIFRRFFRFYGWKLQNLGAKYLYDDVISDVITWYHWFWIHIIISIQHSDWLQNEATWLSWQSACWDITLQSWIFFLISGLPYSKSCDENYFLNNYTKFSLFRSSIVSSTRGVAEQKFKGATFYCGKKPLKSGCSQSWACFWRHISLCFQN